MVKRRLTEKVAVARTVGTALFASGAATAVTARIARGTNVAGRSTALASWSAVASEARHRFQTAIDSQNQACR
jgi:predicted naringenin-chalcone synthase